MVPASRAIRHAPKEDVVVDLEDRDGDSPFGHPVGDAVAVGHNTRTGPELAAGGGEDASATSGAVPLICASVCRYRVFDTRKKRISAARSAEFDIPAESMLVPGANCCGSFRNSSSLLAFQVPECFARALEY